MIGNLVYFEMDKTGQLMTSRISWMVWILAWSSFIFRF